MGRRAPAPSSTLVMEICRPYHPSSRPPRALELAIRRRREDGQGGGGEDSVNHIINGKSSLPDLDRGRDTVSQLHFRPGELFYDCLIISVAPALEPRASLIKRT